MPTGWTRYGMHIFSRVSAVSCEDEDQPTLRTMISFFRRPVPLTTSSTISRPGAKLQSKETFDMKIRFPASTLRDPGDSEIMNVRIEDAVECDGSACGELSLDECGEEQNPGPHRHLVESGMAPEAGPRFYLI